jgi:phage protein D
MNPITYNIDEFGRDMSLHKTLLEIENDKYIKNLFAKFKTMSWAEINYELEEEEEQQKEEEEQQKEEETRQRLEKEKAKNDALTLERKALIAKGEYELEEGEIID